VRLNHTKNNNVVICIGISDPIRLSARSVCVGGGGAHAHMRRRANWQSASQLTRHEETARSAWRSLATLDHISSCCSSQSTPRSAPCLFARTCASHGTL
jgi:hypothetical protein